MSGGNPFEDYEEDSSFESKAKRSNAITADKGITSRCHPTSPFEEDDRPSLNSQDIQQESGPARRLMLAKQKMNSQLETTNRCLGVVYETEAVGIAMAEELIVQGEKLENIERNVDKILDSSKESQKHINSIKSVFGNLKNWWSGENKKAPSSSNSSSARDRSNTSLSRALSADQKRDDHPAIKSKGYDVKGFYNTDVMDFKDYDPDSFGRSSSSNEVKSMTGAVTKVNTFKEYEDGLDKNLNLMSNGIGKLKDLALGLGEEIDYQNKHLEKITDKVDRSDAKMRHQNMQLKQILGK